MVLNRYIGKAKKSLLSVNVAAPRVFGEEKRDALDVGVLHHASCNRERDRYRQFDCRGALRGSRDRVHVRGGDR